MPASDPVKKAKQKRAINKSQIAGLRIHELKDYPCKYCSNTRFYNANLQCVHCALEYKRGTKKKIKQLSCNKWV